MKAAKVWKSVGVVALGLILITGGITGGFFIGKNNVETNPTGGDHVEISDGVGGAVIGEIHTSNAISLSTVVLAEEEYEDYGVSALAETAYTITVTPTPADAVDTFEWTSSDSSSVTVSPSNNGKTCTVSCLKAFSTQITLTCTSTHNSDVSATVTVDYVKRLSSVSVSFEPTSATFGESATSHTFTATPVWGTGTITPTNFTVSGGRLENNLTELTTWQCRTWPSSVEGLSVYCYRELTT
ncbi:MAG: Ig-like domain-containing protein, partial [Candidatus Gallimonas sp.]